jgi:hypothetical protein
VASRRGLESPAQEIDKLVCRFRPKKSGARRILAQKTHEGTDADEVLICQSLRHAEKEDQPGSPCSAKRNAGIAAPDPEHDLIDQIGAQMRKRDLVVNRTGMNLLMCQQTPEKFFRLLDSAIVCKHSNDVTQGAVLGSRAQLQGDLLFVEEIGWGYGHDEDLVDS